MKIKYICIYNEFLIYFNKCFDHLVDISVFAMLNFVISSNTVVC